MKKSFIRNALAKNHQDVSSMDVLALENNYLLTKQEIAALSQDIQKSLFGLESINIQRELIHQISKEGFAITPSAKLAINASQQMLSVMLTDDPNNQNVVNVVSTESLVNGNSNQYLKHLNQLSNTLQISQEDLLDKVIDGLSSLFTKGFLLFKKRHDDAVALCKELEKLDNIDEAAKQIKIDGNNIHYRQSQKDNTPLDFKKLLKYLKKLIEDWKDDLHTSYLHADRAQKKSFYSVYEHIVAGVFEVRYDPVPGKAYYTYITSVKAEKPVGIDGKKFLTSYQQYAGMTGKELIHLYQNTSTQLKRMAKNMEDWYKEIGEGNRKNWIVDQYSFIKALEFIYDGMNTICKTFNHLAREIISESKKLNSSKE